MEIDLKYLQYATLFSLRNDVWVNTTAEILYCWLVNTRSLGIKIRFHFAGKPGLGHEMMALFSATVDFILAFESLSVLKHVNVSHNISMLFCYSAI